MTIDPQVFKQLVQVRWADIDANIHLRHSVYYEMCAQSRMGVLGQLGLTMTKMKECGVLPIIFREECKFLREIRHEDEIYLDVALSKLSKDFRKFSFRHQFTRGDELCAVSEVDAAWLDHAIRKVTVPPKVALDALEQIPRTSDFEWV